MKSIAFIKSIILKAFINISLFATVALIGCSATTRGGASKSLPNDAAPALTAVHITHVSSADNVSGELIADETMKTTNSYSGSWLHVTTTEDGYGMNERGKLSGQDATLLSKNPLPNTPGATVTGWELTWEFKPCQSGVFVFTGDSEVGPSNTKSTQQLQIN